MAAYFQAADEGARIRAAGMTRAARATAQAEAAAAAPDAEAARAVAELRALGEVNAEIARMCGISVAAVRKLAASGRKDAGVAEARSAVSGDASMRHVPEAGLGEAQDVPGSKNGAGLAKERAWAEPRSARAGSQPQARRDREVPGLGAP